MYKDAFRPAGALTPPIEYYRNMDRNWELTAAIADRTIDVPCLMISAADDPVLTPAMTDGHGGARARPRAGGDRELRPLDAAGAPEETTAAMLAYLRRLDRWYRVDRSTLDDAAGGHGAVERDRPRR